ncbi:MAG: hypothetical protein JXA41_08890 [Deltaproteobacteria bacterium]|nr:hypothetical protein [Deltaproteobacteria bacterium]
MRKLSLPFLFLSLIALLSVRPVFASVPQLGDLNDNGQINLADAILALQTLSRIDTTGTTVSLNNGDFNLDGEIALPEAVFILQAVAGLRDIAVSTRDVSGTVTVPDGFAPAVDSLFVYGMMGKAAVGPSGGFTLPVSGSDIALVVLTNAAGTPLMLGYTSGAGNAGVINAGTTAVALLFHGLRCYTQPPSTWAQILQMIGETTQVQTLANVIAARLVVDAKALSQQDPAITDALADAVDEILAQRQTTAQSTSSTSVAATVTVSRSAQSADITHIKVDGASPHSGVYIEPAKAGNGIIARNDFRRHVLVLVYRTGWEDTSGTVHHTPWELVVNGPFEPFASGAYLMAVTAVGGVIPSLIDYVAGNTVYKYSETSLIPLPMFPGIDPEQVVKTFYHVVAVGDGEAEPVVPAGLTGVAGDIEEAHSVMQALEVFKEMLLPLLFAIIPADELAVTNNLNKEYVSTVLDVLNIILQGVPDATTYYAVGDYKNLFVSVAKTLGNNPQILNRIGTRLAKTGLIKGWNAATNSAVSGVAQKALILLAVADKVITAFDTGVLAVHLANSQAYVEWDATVVWPPVRVQPKPATVEPGKNVQIMVTIGGETGNTDDYFYKFTWTTAGQYGKIVNPTGTSPPGMQVVMTSRSPGARINYEADSSAAPGDQDPVDVVVHRIGTGGSLKLGSDATTVTVSGSHVDLDPATANVEPETAQTFTAVVKPEPDAGKGDVYYYRWENSAQYGHLSGGSDAFELPDVKTVTYVAEADKEGVDGVSLSVYRERPGAQRELLGIASSMVNVRKPYAVQLTPQGKKLAFGAVQIYTANLVPEPEAGTQLIYAWDNTATVGTLTGAGGTDHFEQTENQATYQAGESAGTDVISIKVYRVVGGEYFPIAEASSTVTVARYAMTIPSTLEINWYSRVDIQPGVTPSRPPTGTYFFRWTNTAAKGTLSDSAGHTDNFDSTNTYVKYRAHSDVPDGVDTVRVELYTTDGGTDTLQDSAECAITVSGPVDVPIVVKSDYVKYEEYDSYGAKWERVYGRVAMTCSKPAQCNNAPTVYINTHGRDDSELVRNDELRSNYEGWQKAEWGGGLADRCQPAATHPAQAMFCALAPPGTHSLWLRDWASGRGYYNPSWEPEMEKQLNDDIEKILPTLDVYNSWSYNGECWKEEKRN